MQKNKSKRSKSRQHRRNCGRTTPTTVSPELRKRQDELIETIELSAPEILEIFRRLGLHDMAMNEQAFRGHASKCHRATGTKRTKAKPPRRYQRDYGHPTPTTVSPEMRKRADAMIDNSDLPDKGMFRKLGFDRIGMNEEGFRSYASKRRRATGRRRIGKARIEAAASMLFGFLSNTFPRRAVNGVIKRMGEMGSVADTGAPR